MGVLVMRAMLEAADFWKLPSGGVQDLVIGKQGLQVLGHWQARPLGTRCKVLLHSSKQTWNLKRGLVYTTVLLIGLLFRFHASLGERSKAVGLRVGSAWAGEYPGPCLNARYCVAATEPELIQRI